MWNIWSIAHARKTTFSDGKFRWLYSSLVRFEFRLNFVRLIDKLIFRDLEKIAQPIYSVKGHTEIINAIDAVGGLGIGEGAPEIATASRDGTWKMVGFDLLIDYV